MKYFLLIEKITESFSKSKKTLILKIEDTLQELSLKEDIDYNALKKELLEYKLFLKYHNNEYIVYDLHNIYSKNKIREFHD